jgi:hypothetical protein
MARRRLGPIRLALEKCFKQYLGSDVGSSCRPVPDVFVDALDEPFCDHRPLWGQVHDGVEEIWVTRGAMNGPAQGRVAALNRVDVCNLTELPKRTVLRISFRCRALGFCVATFWWAVTAE